MNILFPIISAGSGSDIYIQNLVWGLINESINAHVQNLPQCSGHVPRIAGRLCNYLGYDITHTNTWNGYGFKGNIPMVTTEYHVVHDPLFRPYTSQLQRLYYRKIYGCEQKSLACADQVTVISQFTQKKMEEVFGYSDSQMIYCGIDPSLFIPVEIPKSNLKMKEKTMVLLFVGNHLRRKGSDLLEPIMKELGDDYILLTTSGLRTENKIKFNNIRSLGKLDLKGLVRAYNLCDILLFPSRLEGFGLTVAEAMACGKPVVTTDCSSLPELVIDGKGGYLCPMDDVSAFAEAIRHLAEDENLRARMGRFNRQRVLDHFTIEKMTREYIRVYRKIA